MASMVLLLLLLVLQLLSLAMVEDVQQGVQQLSCWVVRGG
jgi:hypothetical protein